MAKVPALTPFQLLPHFLLPVRIGAETSVNTHRQVRTQPELGFEVGVTNTLVADLFKSWGYEVHTSIDKSGMVGQLKLSSDTHRLDIQVNTDALPIVEVTGPSYASRSHGRMHVCSYDKYTAILPTAAKALTENRDFDGALNLIFQPDEENLYDAHTMIKGDLFERLPRDTIHALHNMPGIPAGNSRVLPGPVSLSSDVADATIRGMGGHGTMPHRARDPIVVSAIIITAL